MKLFYFTMSYPFGMGERWKADELEVLAERFDEITVVPFTYQGNFNHPKLLPPGVRLEEPLFRQSSFPFSMAKALWEVLSSKYRIVFLKEFFAKKVYKRRNHLKSWLQTGVSVSATMRSPVIQKIIAGLDKQTILYFFWGKGSVEILPFIDMSGCFMSFVRFHRFDLFENENGNYIPYRRPLLEKIDVAAPCSEAGRQHLMELYPDLSKKIKLFRLGTRGNGRISPGSADGILRVVSCSHLTAVKRVHLMIECLRYLDIPVVWRHIGDGEERSSLERLIKKYSLEDKFILEGLMDTDKVLDFYTAGSFDVFVNVSSSEGVPVSIMEAFSVSIPVLATDVGGVSEIVDNEVGSLLPADLRPEVLASALRDFYLLPSGRKALMRKNALAVASERCNSVKLANELAGFLNSYKPVGNLPGE